MTSSQPVRRVGVRIRLRVAVETPDASARNTVSLPPSEQGLGSVDRNTYYAEFSLLVRRLIRQYGQDAEIREDLTGELYCRFCALLESYDPSRGIPLRPYLIHQLAFAAHTYARQQWRNKKREANGAFLENCCDEKTVIDPTAEWLAAIVHEQVAQSLPAALELLPSRQRSVVLLRYFEDRSFEDIAEILAVRPATVRSLLRYALKNLRKVMYAPESL